MVKIENECVDCPPDLGCIGSACKYKNVPRYYCDICGKNICDYIPKKSDIKIMGMGVTECTIKKHCDYRQIRKICKQADYC